MQSIKRVMEWKLSGSYVALGVEEWTSKTQVRSGHRSRSGQRKNIFLPRKLTIFNSKVTRYEKESVIMRGIVYFKLQDVALRD